MSSTTTTAGPEAFVNIDRVADFLGVSTKTISRWLARSERFPVYWAGRQRRFRLSEVERWMATNKQTAGAKPPRRRRA